MSDEEWRGAGPGDGAAGGGLGLRGARRGTADFHPSKLLPVGLLLSPPARLGRRRHHKRVLALHVLEILQLRRCLLAILLRLAQPLSALLQLLQQFACLAVLLLGKPISQSLQLLLQLLPRLLDRLQQTHLTILLLLALPLLGSQRLRHFIQRLLNPQQVLLRVLRILPDAVELHLGVISFLSHLEFDFVDFFLCLLLHADLIGDPRLNFRQLISKRRQLFELFC
mmetsp:Transcript_23431/g.52642  ORF Transcript_23431/g.52642 Transcript_23431/m.52642 type:complete len:225 (+) Transcript_23431:62-736(+)